MKYYRIVCYFMLCYSALACRSQNSSENETNTSIINIDSSQPRKVTVELDTFFRNLLSKWDEAINNGDKEELLKMYAPEVKMFGRMESGSDAVKDMLSSNGKPKSFTQSVDDFSTFTMNSGSQAVRFRKVLNAKGSIQVFDDRLVFEKQGEKWLIISEGLSNNDQSSEGTCEKIVEKIFLSSPEVQKLLKQPNVNYKLEFSPDSKEGDHKNYHYWVYADNPASNSIETYGRFIFDMDARSLLDINLIDKSKTRISFDNSLLAQLREKCKSEKQGI